MNDTHVIIQFGQAIPSEAQAVVMLAMEKTLREMGFPAEVFKHTMPDDSKLRSKMTPLERSKL